MNLTISIIFLVIAFLALFDIYIIMKKGKYESVSAHIIRGSKKYPVFVLIFGIVLGHLFWSMRTDDVYKDVECKKKDSIAQKDITN